MDVGEAVGAVTEEYDAYRWQVGRAFDERDHWIRLFNRLEAAVTHHKRAQGDLPTDADEALYVARDKILRDAATP
jgi:hypothetical protein